MCDLRPCAGFRGHAMSVNLEFERAISVDEAATRLQEFPGIVFHESQADFPVAADVQDTDDVHVGRLRVDPSVPNGLVFWVVADNLRKGAATNAIQIAEMLCERGRLTLA